MLKPNHATSLLAGILGLVTFALPWVAQEHDRYIPYALIADSPIYAESGAINFWILWLVPIGACIIIAASLVENTPSARTWTIISSIAGLSAVLYTQIRLWLIPASNDPSTAPVMSVGAWLAALAFLIALITALFRLADAHDEANREEYINEQMRKQHPKR